MRAARTEDIDLIKDIIVSVWDTISEDGYDHKEWVPNPYRTAYVVVYDDQERPVAILSATPANATAMHAHIHIPPEHRSLKYEIGEELKRFLFAETEFSSIVVYVPVIFENVIGYVKRLGFKEAGRLVKAHRKNGELHDMDILQLRKEGDT